ncbi:hypothetical protein PSYPI_48732, partial [Pseudomonas syringae pv. pisi str. 1704B]
MGKGRISGRDSLFLRRGKREEAALEVAKAAIKKLG